MRLRDAGEELPACLWLASPWTDLTMSGATLATKDAVDPLIHKAYLGELADAYVPAGMARTDPRISPLFADLRELPPTLIQVGSAETLLDDSVRFAGAAGAAGVAVTLEVWPNMIHAWALWNAKLEAGRQSLAHAGAFMRRYLRGRLRAPFDGRSQTLHLNAGAGSPGSTITEVNSPQPPHCRTSLVGSFTMGLVAMAMACSLWARSSALVMGAARRRCFMSNPLCAAACRSLAYRRPSRQEKGR